MISFDSAETDETLLRRRIPPASIRRRLVSTVIGFGSLAIATCLLAPLIGTTPISLTRALDPSVPLEANVDAQIFFVARLPRVLAGALVGSTLASAGVIFQAMLRNPLATPFTLGVSAGASLGAMLVIIFGGTLMLGPLSTVPAASFAGAAAATAVVYWLATRQGHAISTSVLLLAGVTLNSFLSAIIMFVQYFADFAQVYRATRWLMGDLDIGEVRHAHLVVAAGHRRLRAVRVAAFVTQSAQCQQGYCGRPRRGRSTCATAGVLQRIAGNERSRLAGRAHRLRRDCGAAPRSTAGRRRSSNCPAGLGPFWSSVSRRMRCAGADASRPDRDSRGCRNRNDWRAVLSVASRARKLTAVVAVAVIVVCSSAPLAQSRNTGSSPRRIVSLVPAITEMLFAIGAGPQVAAVSSYDEFPPEVKALPKVGALLDPDTERIFALRPDLVVVYGSQSDLQTQLQRAGIRTFSYRHGGIATTLDTIRELGAVTGHEKESGTLVSSLQARLDAVRDRVKGRSQPRVLLVFERQPGALRDIYASGGVGFLHEMLNIAGGRNRVRRRAARSRAAVARDTAGPCTGRDSRSARNGTYREKCRRRTRHVVNAFVDSCREKPQRSSDDG